MLLDKTADPKGGCANLDLVANRLAEAFCQQWIDNGAPLPLLLGRQSLQGFIRNQFQFAVEGIQSIRDQYLGPKKSVTAAATHDGVEFPDQRNVAGGPNPLEHFIRQGLAGIQLYITAQQRPGIRQQALFDHPVKAGCRSYQGDAQNKTGQKDLQRRDP